MARIRWQGDIYPAVPIRKLENGDWLMEARAHGPRFSPGTEIRVTAGEIIEMNEPAVDDTASAAKLEAAMAEERKSLPAVKTLLEKAPKTTESDDGA